jgi:hypothetical protein
VRIFFLSVHLIRDNKNVFSFILDALTSNCVVWGGFLGGYVVRT